MSKPRMGAPKRVAIGLLAGALSIFGIAHAPSAGATDDVTTERLAGTTRYGTAAAVAADEAFASPTMAIVASGENSHLADALAASTLSGANAPAPIILTQTDTYTADAKTALAALKGKGVSRVTIVGGTAAITAAVETAIKGDGFTVTRVAGTDRFGTAAAIEGAARAAHTPAPVGGKKTAFIASGFSFADALAGSPAAAKDGLPMLLTNVDSLPQATKDALDAGDITQAIILGGTVPVSDAVAAELKSLTGSDPVRLAGVNRFGTAAAIGDYEIDTLGFAGTSAIIANGLTLVDALTAGPLGGLLGAPIALTASCPAETTAWLDKWSALIAKLYIVGGTAAVDAATATCAETAAETTNNDPAVAGKSQTSVLNGPELQSVRLSDIDLDDFGTFGDGYTVEYTFEFDSALDDNVDESLFHLYDADTNRSADGDEADVSGNSVAVDFVLGGVGQPPTPDAVLAAVETGAVEDEDGNENPPQSVKINALSAAGGTGADLTDAELTDEDEGTVTYVFNSPVHPDLLDFNTMSFTYVLEDGTTDTLLSGNANVEGDEGADDPSPNIEVTFDSLADDPDDNDDPTIDDIARVYVTSNSTGRVQNVDFGDVDDAADLDSVQLPDSNSDLDDDEVLFSFDEDIDTADPAAFHLYYGVSASGIADGTAIDIDGNDVTVTFTEEQVNDYVAGGFVDDDATGTNADGDDEDAALPFDSIADGELLSYTGNGGEVLGPQLDGVEITQETDSFGDFEEFDVTFTFNKELADDDDISGFSIWINDGDDLEEVNLDNCDTDNDNQVVCTDDDEDSDIAGALVASVDYGVVETEDDTDLGNGADTYVNPEGSFEASLSEA